MMIFDKDFQHWSPRLLGLFDAKGRLMDSSELKELYRVSGGSKSLAFRWDQPSDCTQSPPRERASEKHALKLPTLSFFEGLRLAEDLVQSLLLLTNLLRMYKAELYRHRAF